LPKIKTHVAESEVVISFNSWQVRVQIEFG
jgi:hypothetical protein